MNNLYMLVQHTSLNTMYCGGEPEQHQMYYLCTDFAIFSKWHYIIVQKQGAEGSHEHISECTKSMLYNLY